LKSLRKLGLFLLLLHKEGPARFGEIDALRGVAIVMMVVYHFAYDLTYFGYYQANVFVGPWRTFARITAILFVTLAGISLVISYSRLSTQVRGWYLFRKYLSRGLKLLGWGIVVSLTTWAFLGRPVIIFGILHLIGTATILVYPFLRLPRWTNLVIGIGAIASGLYLNRWPVQQPWLLLLGLRPPWLYQLDYFPLLPWLGVALLGVLAGQVLYPDGRRAFDAPDLQQWPPLQTLARLGHHSLAIYLVHQPLLFGVLTLVSLAYAGSP